MANSGLEEYRRKLKEGLVEKTRDKNRPSAIKAIREKCLDCMNGYKEGRNDCGIEKCSLWYFMPYNRIRTEKRKFKKMEKEKQVVSEIERNLQNEKT